MDEYDCIYILWFISHAAARWYVAFVQNSQIIVRFYNFIFLSVFHCPISSHPCATLTRFIQFVLQRSEVVIKLIFLSCTTDQRDITFSNWKQNLKNWNLSACQLKPKLWNFRRLGFWVFSFIIIFYPTPFQSGSGTFVFLFPPLPFRGRKLGRRIFGINE